MNVSHHSVCFAEASRTSRSDYDDAAPGNTQEAPAFHLPRRVKHERERFEVKCLSVHAEIGQK